MNEHLRNCLDAIYILYDKMERDLTQVASTIPRLRELVGLLDYHVLYGERLGINRTEGLAARSGNVLIYRSCSVEGCRSPLPFYNIKNRRDLPDDWRCSLHIPPSITFPIGLHGDEWAATGRTPVVWRARR